MVVTSLISRPQRAFEPSVRPLDLLASRIKGDVITVDSEAYEGARKTINIAYDRRPMAVVKPVDTEDVVAVITFAQERGYAMSVRSGGHSIMHFGVVDGAIVLDLSGMREVVIDAETKLARVQAGATSADIAAPANALGLALTTGDTSSVGIGGLATGGGIGFMVRKYGLTIDSLVSATVVTASGEVLEASEFENSDLFWAIRGGGGNFGVITEFVFQMAPVDTVLAGEIILPASKEVIRAYLDYSVNAPDELSTIANIMHASPAPFIPQDRIGELVVSILVCWTGDFESGQKALAPLRALAMPVADTVGAMPYPDIYRFTAHQTMPHGVALRSMFADSVSDDSIDAMIDAMNQPSSPFSLVHLRGLGGQLARIPADATAFAHRDKPFFVTVIALWLDPSESAEPHTVWAEGLFNAIRHEGDGVYVNFMAAEGEARLREAYPQATMERLAAIKKTYDPGNFFRFNQNIRPQA